MSLQNKLKRLSDDFHNAAAASFSLYFIRWPVGSCRQVDGPPGLRGGPGISTLMNSKLGIFYIQSEDPSVAYGDHLGRLVDRGGKCLELLPEHVHQRIWGRMATQPPSYDAFGWFAALVELAIHGIDGLSAVPHFWDGITSERPSDYEHFREIVAEQEKIGKIRDWYVKIDDLASACCDAADVLLDWSNDPPSGKADTKPPRESESTEVAISNSDRNAAIQSLNKSARLAILAYDEAAEAMAESSDRVTDRDAWEWSREYSDADCLAFDTFTRYLREARKKLGENKNIPRGGRSGGSIAGQSDL